jgi:hypothetical protein
MPAMQNRVEPLAEKRNLPHKESNDATPPLRICSSSSAWLLASSCPDPTSLGEYAKRATIRSPQVDLWEGVLTEETSWRERVSAVVSYMLRLVHGAAQLQDKKDRAKVISESKSKKVVVKIPRSITVGAQEANGERLCKYSNPVAICAS